MSFPRMDCKGSTVHRSKPLPFAGFPFFEQWAPSNIVEVEDGKVVMIGDR
jgi:hypothetical protein